MRDFRGRINRIKETLDPGKADSPLMIIEVDKNDYFSEETSQKLENECLKSRKRCIVVLPKKNVLELPKGKDH
jgi:hydrogenase maturation factor HypF (carbamoyltransferase family)